MSDQESVVVIDYTNWRGERADRVIRPKRLYFGASPFHPEPQWLLEAYAVDKGDYRDFAMVSIHGWRAAAAEPPAAPPKEENLWLKHCRHASSCIRHQGCQYFGCPLKDNSKLKAWMAEEVAVKTWP